MAGGGRGGAVDGMVPAASRELQQMLTKFKSEVDRLKRENREMRARGSVAERNYRTVMVENERLSKKIEHLEEIFVHQVGLEFVNCHSLCWNPPPL